MTMGDMYTSGCFLGQRLEAGKLKFSSSFEAGIVSQNHPTKSSKWFDFRMEPVDFAIFFKVPPTFLAHPEIDRKAAKRLC